MIERLINIENRYNELTDELMKQEVISNIKETLKLTREQASLKEAYEDLNKEYSNAKSSK